MVRVPLAVVAVAGVLPGLVAGHGWMLEPLSREEYCNANGKNYKNTGCGPIKWEPQSVEGPDGYPDSGPPDGELASGGPNSRFRELDEQGANRWTKTKITPGDHTFEWYLQANHVTKDFRYFITKPGWDQNAPLARSAFYPTPFCHHDLGNVMPPQKLTHTCTIPATHSGYHIVFAIWEVGDTPNSFFNILDLDISPGGGSGPAPPVVPTPPVVPVPVPSPPQPTGTFTPGQGCQAMDLQTGNPKIQVTYELGTTSGEEAVQFTLRFPSNGYGSIGFRAAGSTSMAGLDLMTVDSANKVVIDSATLRAPGKPTPDTKQDAVLVSHQNMGTYTVAKFFRKLDTGNDFTIFTGRPIGFAWAYGGGFGNKIAYHHTNARAMDVTLERRCTSAPPSAPAPSNGQCANDARYPGYELCQNAPNCCKGGNKCYSFGNQMSFCLPFCPAGWPCNNGYCQKQGDYLRCEGDESCCPTNTQCFSYDDNVKYCLASCPAGWACKNQAPAPAPKASTCQTAQGNGAVWELCKGDENCCASGKMCYVFSNHYSFCMDRCPDGWACNRNGNGQ